MPKESFYPDTNEPHIHLHRGGATFTDIGHNHRTLVRGSLVYRGTVQEVIVDLQGRGDNRSIQIAQYIQSNLA
ncbi:MULTISPECIES: hypothetical protein [Aeromonas]|uniref:DUF4160 domain-containing protein n=1 Tax=Aeromonas eucrenophila TaxID=649 RepID=A0ABW0YE41_9GAMM|nr:MULTISPECIES: hypothetical protein [Aeromonas]MCH7369612.1 hypothetical protein [Aeromonas sp. MR16]